MPFSSVRIPLLLLTTLAVAACGRDHAADTAKPATPALNSIGRVDFNRRAAELFLPVFWREDSNANGIVEPGEVAILTGYPQGERSAWMDASGAFTPAFHEAYARMAKADATSTDAAEQTRHRLVL